MRTTITLDDDVLLAVKERARREQRRIGDVLSDLARCETLPTGQHHSAKHSMTGAFFGFEPFPHRGEAVSNALIDRLRESGPE